MSDSTKISDLERRLERLEEMVQRLVAPKPIAPPAPAKIRQSPPPLPNTAKEGINTSFGERWLARVGVLLLFLALSFLFKYAADQGWVNPTVRVIFGVVLATAMLITGLKLHATRLRYSQILLGGSIAIYYLCGFASHQLYGLVEHTPAFLYMVGVTLTALFLAVKQDHPSLACIGIAGGLSTPFLLSTPWGTIPALVLYTSTLLVGGGLILLRRGWRTLAMTLWIGGLPVISYCIEEVAVLDQDFLIIGIAVWWTIGGLLPMLYNWKAQRFPKPTAQAVFSAAELRAGAAVSSGVAFVMAAWNWQLIEREELWPLALLFGAGYALLHGVNRSSKHGKSVAIEMAVAFGFLTTAIAFESDQAFLSLLTGSALVLYLSRYAAFATSRVLSYGVISILALWFGGDCLQYLSDYGNREPGLHMLTRLALLPAMVWASTFPKEKNLRHLWQLFAYVGLLSWTFTELRWLENGVGLTTAAWAVQGGVALLFGLKTKNSGAQSVALSTLALVSGKMLLFDMANMDMIWRILLFFGVGAAFLGLSYVMNRPKQHA
jgi:uncharacterized membrane protein